MAVYYKWIKGCALGANLTEGLWTYIYWPKGNKEGVLDATGLSAEDYLPKLYQSSGRNVSPDTVLDDQNKQELYKGYFLTNCATGVQINEDWKWKNGKKIQFDSLSISKDGLSGSWTIGPDSTKTLTIQTKTEMKSTLKIDDALTASNIEATSIALNSYCQAEYFNATSDKRAKENIKPAEYSAVSIIKKLPVYIYNYKNSNETVTGIIAQDLLEVQPKELDLVSNVNATGENNDFMSIKNDKLMFVLMKAIQEQQEKIEYLEQELNKIKNN